MTAASSDTARLRTRGTDIVDQQGRAVRLRGVGLGGWLNMENFITGYSANEALMRSTVRRTLGDDKYELFFERLLSVFFDDADAQLLADLGLNCVRIPVNYRHFEDDSKPFEIRAEGFRHLDRVIESCAAHGIYTVVDLHALPGSQNHHWHSDNQTHLPAFWTHPHFQDRVVHLWEFIADRYRDNPWVAGYNPINEPADESREVVGPFYDRLVKAIRDVDPGHTLFLDGNTYSTEFDVFGDPWDNTVYTCHDYVRAGLGSGGPYPGQAGGEWVDKAYVEKKFLDRTEYCRRTGTPIWVGEFGPTYTGDPETDAQRGAILADQLEIYGNYNAGWSIWTYKDLGLQGLATVRPDSPYGLRFGDFVKKKARLAADSWGSDGEGPAEVTRPFQDMMAREFPGFDDQAYPWGRSDWVKTLILNITIAQPLAYEYAELFRDLTEEDLLALADSFALRNCDQRTTLLEQLQNG
jgi:endoglucanase